MIFIYNCVHIVYVCVTIYRIIFSIINEADGLVRSAVIRCDLYIRLIRERKHWTADPRQFR